MKNLMIATDYDGTLSNLQGAINSKSLDFLQKCPTNIKRVVITGRSLFTSKKVMNETFPIDYLVFSSGAGIMNWKNKEIILNKNFTKNEIKTIFNKLKDDKYDFFLHKAIPDNHFCYCVKSTTNNVDFNKRVDLYSKEITFIDNLKDINDNLFTQFVIVIPEKPSDELRNKIKNIIDDNLSLIMTTSPINHKSTWIEIFPKDTNKGKALLYLTDRLKIDKNKVMAIGNDHNDHDMLKIAGYSYLVNTSNAKILDIKHLKIIENSSNEGFILACNDYLNRVGNE